MHLSQGNCSLQVMKKHKNPSTPEDLQPPQAPSMDVSAWELSISGTFAHSVTALKKRRIEQT